MRREEVVEEVDMLAGELAEVIASRLGMTPGAIAKALSRAGHKDKARPFWALDRLRWKAAAVGGPPRSHRPDTPTPPTGA